VTGAAKYDGGVRASWVVSAATAFVLLGASILVFLNPVWVGFEQGRADVADWTRTCPAAYQPFTNAILGNLAFGGDFDIASAGSRCDGTRSILALAPAERSHMQDVRGVFQGFFLLVALSVAALVVTFRRRRDPATRAAWLQAVRRGAAALAVVIAVLGAVSLVAFDAAFELFHQLFFAPGSYDFDPATSRLVQLFPDQFWSDTTLALGIVVLAASGVIAWLATRRLGSIATGAAAGAPTARALEVGKAAR